MCSYNEKDWFMRQIKSLVKAISNIFFKSEDLCYEIRDERNMTDTDVLFKRIEELLSDRKIKEAQSILTSNIQNQNLDFLKLTLYFYDRISDFDDQDFIDNHFSKEDAYDELEKITNSFLLMEWQMLY